MKWYRFATNHEDTYNGELLAQEKTRISQEVEQMLRVANENGPISVIPRFKGEIRQRMLKLPLPERIANMSMYELNALSSIVASIQTDIDKYDEKKLTTMRGDLK